MVVSQHVMERETRDEPTGLRQNPEALIGTGPFTYADYQPGVSFKVRKSPTYWDSGKPYLDGIDFLIIRDAATRFSALATGQVHMSPHGSPSLTAAQAQQAQKEFSEGIRLERVRGPFWIGAAFNAARTPLDDPRVRQAMSLAVDRQAYVAVVTGGAAEGTGMVAGFSPPGAPFALPQAQLLGLPGYRQPKEQDLARARELLADAGYTDGFKTTVMVRSDTPVWVDAALFFQDQWKSVGIDAQVEQVDFATSIQRMLRGDFDIRISGIAFNLADADQVLFAPFSSQGPNFLYYPQDAELDRLLEAQRRELDQTRRQGLARQAELRLLQEVVPAVVGHYSIYIYGTRPEVGGWQARDYMLYNQERMDTVWLHR
jgi:peptide/nickel transport system substrate-binding protein